MVRQASGRRSTVSGTTLKLMDICHQESGSTDGGATLTVLADIHTRLHGRKT